MYALEAMKFEIAALAQKRPSPLGTHATGNKRFDEAWLLYLEHLRAGNHGYLEKWKAASHYSDHEGAGVAAAPLYVQQATRFIAMSFVLCGQEVAAKEIGQPILSALKTSTPGSIMHYITTVADAVEGMSAYMKKHGKAIPPGAPVRSNINEFYSLAMVALHETRLKADAAFQETIDNTIDLCIDQLVGIGMQPNIPMDIGNQIKARRFLRTAEMAGPPAQPQQHQHQQPQWQRLRSRPDAITTTSTARTPATATSDTSDFGAVIAASTDEAGVTSLAEIRKRMHLARVKKNLDDKQGGPQPTGPK